MPKIKIYLLRLRLKPGTTRRFYTCLKCVYIDTIRKNNKNILIKFWPEILKWVMQFSHQLVSQCCCETSCWRIAQRNMGFLAIFLLREALHEVQFHNRLQQLATPLHSVSPLQQLVSQFYSSFNRQGRMRTLFVFRSKEHCETSC